MSEENPGHTLRATELVHEAFLRIGQDRRLPFQNKKAAQHAAARGRKDKKAEGADRAETPEIRGFATGCDVVQDGKVTLTGFEPVLRP